MILECTLSILTILLGSIFGTGELIPQDTTPPDYAQEEFNTVSGGDYFPGFSESLEAPAESPVPELSELQEQVNFLLEENAALQDEIMLLNSGSASAVEAYLSSTLLEVMERVIQGNPFCSYVAYRTDLSDSNQGTLVYGKRASVSGNQITIENAKVVTYYRYRYSSSYNWEYRYNVQEYDSYSVSYTSNTLLYTNVLDGYPTLGNTNQVFLYVAIGIIGIFSVVLILRRK